MGKESKAKAKVINEKISKMAMRKRKFPKEIKNVVLLAPSDTTCLGHEYASALKTVGINAIMLVERKHKFDYVRQGKLCTSNEERIEYVSKADVVHFLHSCKILKYDYLPLDNKIVVMSHTGSPFRVRPARHNRRNNSIVDATLMSLEDYNKPIPQQATNPYWFEQGLAQPLETKYKRSDTGKLVIVYYPRGARKGVTEVNSVMKELESSDMSDKFIYHTGDVVSHPENIKRVSKCDIYIERLPGTFNVCEYGIAGLEAATLGKIVVTSYIYLDTLTKVYKELNRRGIISKERLIEKDEFGPVIANTPAQLRKRILWLLSLSDNEILKLKKKSRDWVEKMHSHKAIGELLLGIYNDTKKRRK